MITNHTPSPWEQCGQAIYSDGLYIAQCWDETSRELPEYSDAIDGCTVPDCEKEASANARLIASAPELLEALEALERVESSPHSETTRYLAREQARTAIAKAKGVKP